MKPFEIPLSALRPGDVQLLVTNPGQGEDTWRPYRLVHRIEKLSYDLFQIEFTAIDSGRSHSVQWDGWERRYGREDREVMVWIDLEKREFVIEEEEGIL